MKQIGVEDAGVSCNFNTTYWHYEWKILNSSVIGIKSLFHTCTSVESKNTALHFK